MFDPGPILDPDASQRRRALESGQAMVEFGGVLLIVSLIVAAVVAFGLPGTVAGAVSRTTAAILVGGSVHSSRAGGGTGSPGGSALAAQVRSAAANSQRLVDQGGDGWGNPGTLARHFADHGGDFGSPNAQAYAQEAQQFLQRAVAERLPMKVGPDGTIRVYDPNTNTFGSYDPDGTTKTYFKPSAGEQYWQRQPGQDPWAEAGRGEPGSGGGEPGSGGGNPGGGGEPGSGGGEPGSGGEPGGGGAPGGGEPPAPEPPVPEPPPELPIPDIPIVP